jgi:hemoglobin-like flavoprotein
VIQGSSSLDDKDHRQDSGVALSKHSHNQSFSHGSSSQHINNQHQMNTVRQQHTSMAGAAAPYAGDITRYLNLRNKVAKIATEDEYKELVRTLIAKNVTITIPIFYIKVDLVFVI